MLMRSDATCVTSVQEVRELMGFVTEGESHPVPRVNEQLTLDIGGGAVQSQVTSSPTMASPTVVNVDDPLAGHPLAACGADEAKQKEEQK